MRLTSVLLLLLLTGCRQGMYDQPKAKPLSHSEFFSDGQSSRPLQPHTIAVEANPPIPEFTATHPDGTLVTTLPISLDKALLERGRERYDIYCSVCHDRTGSGRGIIVQRGFPQPPSLRVERLRAAPIGHFYDVITNGYGVMFSYASRIEPHDRWAIAAYIRALQFAVTAAPADLTPTEQRTLSLATP